MPKFRLLLGVLLALLEGAAVGQNPAPRQAEEPGAVIRVSSNLVVVPVSVTDAAGRPVHNLPAVDFRLEEDGRPQQVVALGKPGETPIALAILFDISGSIRERFQFEQQAASNFLKSVLRPSDTVSVFSIGEAPKMVQELTTNAGVATATILGLQPTREATAFYDSVATAAQYLRATAGPGTRRLVLAISDGEDNHSDNYQLAGALRELQRSECLFYSINPGGTWIRLNRISLKGQAALAALAAETGGAFLPSETADLDAVFRRIAAELQTQYLLGYYSTNQQADGAYRRIQVRLPGRPELRVRARQGYYAPRG